MIFVKVPRSFTLHNYNEIYDLAVPSPCDTTYLEDLTQGDTLVANSDCVRALYKQGHLQQKCLISTHTQFHELSQQEITPAIVHTTYLLPTEKTVAKVDTSDIL